MEKNTIPFSWNITAQKTAFARSEIFTLRGPDTSNVINNIPPNHAVSPLFVIIIPFPPPSLILDLYRVSLSLEAPNYCL